MPIEDFMKTNQPYINCAFDIPDHLKKQGQMLCWEYNQTSPVEEEKRTTILKKLFGTCSDLTFIEPSFHCDYGFNIHTHGFAFINYNCVILDTSPVNIGHGAFIGPNCTLACPGHSLIGEERLEALGTSAPITLEDKVWLGAGVTVLAGVTIGEGSIIGAGSVVTHDIPSGVIAFGNPCKVIRKVTDADRIKHKLTPM